jgi:hypothetical protein
MSKVKCLVLFCEDEQSLLFFESRIPGIADVQRYELLASFDRSRAVVRIFFTVQNIMQNIISWTL